MGPQGPKAGKGKPRHPDVLNDVSAAGLVHVRGQFTGLLLALDRGRGAWQPFAGDVRREHQSDRT